MTRALLTADGLTPGDLAKVLDLADELKATRVAGGAGRARGALVRDDLRGVAVGLAFDGQAGHGRVSFEVAVAELGGTPVAIDRDCLQPSDPAKLADSARILSAYLHVIVVSTDRHSALERFAAAAVVPVLCARSSFAHPCQAVADLQTIREHKGGLDRLKLAYLGDGGGVANSLLQAGAMAGMHVAVASPPGYEPIPQVVRSARRLARESGGEVTITADPLVAARDADAVYANAWARAGWTGERDPRVLILRPFRVGARVMEAARPDALVMHSLPLARGEEIDPELFESRLSVVWQQAENRLHGQKALLLHVLGDGGG